MGGDRELAGSVRRVVTANWRECKVGCDRELAGSVRRVVTANWRE